MLLHQGCAAVIDWVDATCGNPLADVARTAVLIQGVENRVAEDKTSRIAWIEVLAMRCFTRIYLRHYFELQLESTSGSGGEVEYQRWWPIVAAGRMSEDIPGLNDWLSRSSVN